MVLILNFTRNSLQLIVALAFFWAINSSAGSDGDTMFEGYYSIKSGGVHVGFVVQRYSFDKKAKNFYSTYYIKTNQFGGDITESLKAVANDKFEPISYQYTSATGGKVKIIDATFKDNKMMATISTDGKEAQSISKDLPKGTFLSTFLVYMMMSKGMNKGKKFTYSALAEEDAEVFGGQSFFQETATVNGLESFKVLNEYKGTKFISMMTKKGEVLNTKSPVQHIATELEATPVKATKGFKLDTKSLKLLFGKMPSGKVNQLVAQPNTKGERGSASLKKSGPNN